MKGHIVFSAIAAGYMVASVIAHDHASVPSVRDISIQQGDIVLQRRSIDDSVSTLHKRARKKRNKEAAQRQPNPDPAKDTGGNARPASIWSLPAGSTPLIPTGGSGPSPSRGAPGNSAITRPSPWAVPPGTFPSLPVPESPGQPSTSGKAQGSRRAKPRESAATVSGNTVDRRSARTTRRPRRNEETPEVTSTLSRIRDTPDSGATLASLPSHEASGSPPKLEFEKLKISSPTASSSSGGSTKLDTEKSKVNSPAVSSSGSTGRPPAPPSSRWQLTSKPDDSLQHSSSSDSPRSKSPPTPPDLGSATTSPTGNFPGSSSAGPSGTIPDSPVHVFNRPPPISNHQPFFERNFQKTKQEIDRDLSNAVQEARKNKGKGPRRSLAQYAGAKEVAAATAAREKAKGLRAEANYEYAIGKYSLRNNNRGPSLTDPAFRYVTASGNEAVAATKEHAQAENAAARALRSGKQYCDAAEHAGNAARAYSRCILRNSVTKSFQDGYVSKITSNLANVVDKNDTKGRQDAFTEAIYMRKNYENSVREYRSRFAQDRKVRDEWPGSSSDESEKSFDDVKRERNSGGR